jgi:hypothetical protein
MRTTAMLVGLGLMLGLTMPVAAAPPDMVQAAPEMLAAYDGMGSGGNRPGMQATGRPAGGSEASGTSRGTAGPPSSGWC